MKPSKRCGISACGRRRARQRVAFWKAVEDLFGRIPVLGTPVQAGRKAAQQQFGEAVLNQAQQFNRDFANEILAPIAKTLSEDITLGHPAVEHVAQEVSNAYKAAIPDAGGPLDADAAKAIQSLGANAKLLLSPERATQFDNFIQQKVLDRIEGGITPGAANAGLNDALQAQSAAAAEISAAQRQAAFAQARKTLAGDNVFEQQRAQCGAVIEPKYCRGAGQT